MFPVLLAIPFVGKYIWDWSASNVNAGGVRAELVDGPYSIPVIGAVTPLKVVAVSAAAYFAYKAIRK